MPFVAAVALGLALVPTLRAQAPVRGSLAAEVGGPVGAGTVVSLGLPFVTGSGTVAFTGTLVADGDTTGFVFVGAAPIWRNRDAGTATLVGREVWMGAGDDGRFAYSPTVDGEDAIWTDLGVLVRRGDPAPGFPGQMLSSASRPGLLPDGTAHWISGVASTAGGPTAFRAFYVSPDRTPASTTVAIAEGQPVGGVNVTTLHLSYALSDDGAHQAFIVTRATGSATTDGAVVLDGAVLAQEGSPAAAGGSDLWSAFDLVRVNAAGHHLISGDTDGPAGSDEVVVYDGQVALREGGTVAGVTLGGDVRGLALNDAGAVVWAWTTTSGATDEALFVGQAADLANSSHLVLRTGQGLDTSGDGVADYTVAGFAFAQGDGHGALDLAAAPVVYARLDLTPAAGGPTRTAIVGLDLQPFLPSAGEPAVNGAVRLTLGVGPNPSTGDVTVWLTLSRAANEATVEVLDVLGRRVSLLHEGTINAGPHAFALDALALRAGVYVVRAMGDGSVQSRTVTVIR